MSDELREMLEVNREQARFYGRDLDKGSNLATRAWRRLRRRMQRVVNAIDVAGCIDAHHRKWLGDLTGRRVLDLGCYSGNRLSLELARNSSFYLGIDLSEFAIDKLRAKLAGIDHANARAVDFLSPDFTERDFDVIYARSVAHHFKHFDEFLQVAADKLAPGGIVVTFDPTQTSLPVRAARGLYRPFQSGSDWEHPFDRNSFVRIERYFDIVAVQGVLGASKWVVPLAALAPGLARRGLVRAHRRDLRRADRRGPALWACMQVAMCWRKPGPEGN